jgi:hypothetical protein
MFFALTENYVSEIMTLMGTDMTTTNQNRTQIAAITVNLIAGILSGVVIAACNKGDDGSTDGSDMCKSNTCIVGGEEVPKYVCYCDGLLVTEQPSPSEYQGFFCDSTPDTIPVDSVCQDLCTSTQVPTVQRAPCTDSGTSTDTSMGTSTSTGEYVPTSTTAITLRGRRCGVRTPLRRDRI